MYQTNDFITESIRHSEKINYIAEMLMRTLYSNDVTPYECEKIIDVFKNKVSTRYVLQNYKNSLQKESDVYI